jgi:hypothetical protein
MFLKVNNWDAGYVRPMRPQVGADGFVGAVSYREWRPFTAMMIKRLVHGLTLLVIALALGCGTQQPQSQPQQPAPASLQRPRPAQRFIYVTDQNLPDECYTDLGPVSFTEPYAESVVDPDQSEAARHVRAAALKKYPRDVDAVINFKSQQNDIGTQVSLSGEAVRLEDHPTVKCALRKSEGVIDTAAELGAGGIAGATAGGLAGGASAAASVALVGASAIGARKVLAHQGLTEQEQEEFSQKLGEQRRQITRLLKERARLRKCQQEELTLKNCPLSDSQVAQSSSEKASTAEKAPDDINRDLTDATAFEVEKHLQEQQDYIKQLEQQIAQIRWQMGGN